MAVRETRTVLIVDGSPTILYYHGILLKRLEYSVLTAANPEDALKLLDRTVPDLILTAISFPLLSGVDFIKKLKAANRTRDIPVIVLSADEHAEVRSVCLNLGCVAYLPKPVEPVQLYRTIQAATESTPRGNIRIGTRLRVVVGEGPAGGNAELTEYATMISEGGLYLRTLSSHPKNALIPVKLFIKDREIRARAMVLYTCVLEGGAFKEPGMALKFIEIRDADRNFLRSFINEQLTSDIADVCN